MENTHDFFGLLRRFGLSRQRALSLAEGAHAQRLDPSALAVMLARAANEEVPLMVFVPNAGCVQIRSGVIKRVASMDGWLNVLDPAFNLHVDERRAGQLWRVEKPTLTGTITSVELFDDQGENVLMVFGVRKGQERERADWRALAQGL
jgi:putative hemin transport protein